MKIVNFLAVFFVLYFSFLGQLGSVAATEVVVATKEAEIVVSDDSSSVQDLTVPKVKVDRMVALLESQKVKNWYPFNFMKFGIRRAVDGGVSVNTIVLLFLFPLVATLVAFSRQVVGLNGFGMITPTLLAMAFLSTGGLVGILMLSFVVSVAILGRTLIKKVKVPFLPKLAILLWIVSMSVLTLIVISPLAGLSRFLEIGIFPIILFVSVAETFVEAQITRNFSASMTMLVEAVLLAVVGYKMMSSQLVQSLVLLNPEAMSVLILLLNMLIGRYKGLRFLEMWRFRKLILK